MCAAPVVVLLVGMGLSLCFGGSLGGLPCLRCFFALQLFFDGAFNADPHPGNILLMPDGRWVPSCLHGPSLNVASRFHRECAVANQSPQTESLNPRVDCDGHLHTHGGRSWSGPNPKGGGGGTPPPLQTPKWLYRTMAPEILF